MTGLSVWKIVELVFGIPSHVSDAIKWLGWINAIPINWQITVLGTTCVFFIALATLDLWRPWLRALRVDDEIRPLKVWLAPDGSITLLQAAFLWIGIPVQTPVPAEVQDKLSVMQNAINQGTLDMHRRHEADTENFLAFARLWAGNPTPPDTRVLPAELKRWAATIGEVPDFLLSVEPFASRDMNERPKHTEDKLS